MHNFLSELEKRIMVFDGAMGTSIQKKNLSSADFDGKDGCNEILNLNKPDVIKDIHRSYLLAGCDVIETNTFGANAVNLSEYGLENFVHKINYEAARIAKKVISEFTGKPRFVAGSIGPGTKSPSRGEITFESLEKTYLEQVKGLAEGGADIFIVETCFDLLQTKTALSAVQTYFSEGRKIPVIVQVTLDEYGRMLLGTEIDAVVSALEPYDIIDVLGLNCATGPDRMNDAIRHLSLHWKKFISCQPNAGLPRNTDGKTHYDLSPQDFVSALKKYIDEYGVNIVGGCCGTAPEHIKLLADEGGMKKQKTRTVNYAPSISSLFSSTPIDQNPKPLLVGERMNATTQTKEFKKFIVTENYDAVESLAKKQIEEGAHALDLCLDVAGEEKTTGHYMENAVQKLYALTVPLFVDSDTPENVAEFALKHIAGRAVINSINLEDGGKRIEKVAGLAKKYGSAVVALAIDEKGQALTAEHKVEVAKRICEMAKAHGIRPEDILFDMLVFPITTGQEEYRTAGRETLKAVSRIKKEIPGAYSILGISNISFGLNKHARRVLNSVFLDEAVKSGLDAAIVNVKHIYPLHQIPAEEAELARNLIYQKHVDNKDPLEAYIEHFSSAKGVETKKIEEQQFTLEDAMKHCIIGGTKEAGGRQLNTLLIEALGKYSALQIINEILLKGMKTVGELFGSGKLQLPFVLKSAEVMKSAVSYLEQYMEKSGKSAKGTLVLATVRGDVHDIGKNLVDIILSNNGYNVQNLGVKKDSGEIIKSAVENNADAIGLSGLLVKSTLEMQYVIEELCRRGLSFPVICGGAALQRAFAESELRKAYSDKGAVFYASDAFEGMRILEALLDEKTRDEIITKGRTLVEKKREMNEDDEAKIKVVRKNIEIPKPPFYGIQIAEKISLSEVYDYINTTALFRGQWQFKQKGMAKKEYEELMENEVKPVFEKLKKECLEIFQPKAIYGYFKCRPEGDDLIVYADSATEMFGFPRQKNKGLCISDYFSSDDVVGFFVVTVGEEAKKRMDALNNEGKYSEYLYLHGMAVESTEALAEYWHKKMREELGIANKDSAIIKELFQQKYRGCRYSFGYPACPNLEDQVKLFRILRPEKIGVILSETHQMIPEESVSAIVVHHPDAGYFGV